MIISKIAILGGTGFVGRTLANRLSRKGYHIRILTRNREKKRNDLILLPSLDLIEADIHNQSQLQEKLAGCDAVINLVGILNERGRNGTGFQRVHVELVKKIINACKMNGIKRIIHISALNADASKGPSFYLKSKGEAELILKENSQDNFKLTCFRPSVIFGPDDQFLNRFAAILKISPLIFPLACAKTRFCPVYVEDVAEAISIALENPKTFANTYELCGPDTLTLEALVRYTARQINVSRIILPLSDILSRIQGFIFDFVPGKPFSTDNYFSAQIDSICNRNDLITLGITPASLTAIAPAYLAHQTYRNNYYHYRSATHHNQTR